MLLVKKMIPVVMIVPMIPTTGEGFGDSRLGSHASASQPSPPTAQADGGETSSDSDGDNDVAHCDNDQPPTVGSPLPRDVPKLHTAHAGEAKAVTPQNLPHRTSDRRCNTKMVVKSHNENGRNHLFQTKTHG